MLKKVLSYFFLLLACAVTMTSCADDIVNNKTQGDGEAREFKGTISFSLSTPDVSLRSRSVNTDAGSTVLINNLWVGVFNTTTGACFGAKRYDEFNRTMQSGVVLNNLIQVDFIAKDEEIPLAYIVAVANYDGVTTWTGTPLEDILPDFDNRSSISWDDVINLDINAESAYQGNKGENEKSNAPFLVGYFQDATTLTQNPKIDQFAYDEQGPTAIYPAEAAEGMDIQLGDETTNNIYVAAGAICLRRLVSHNIVKLNMSNGYEVSEVKYKRFNMPKTVYMLQRRTDTKQRDSFAEWQKFSPNRADQVLKEGQYDYDDPAFPYASDSEWNNIEINFWDDTENIQFVFDHFENKHWGFGDMQSQEDREALNPDGKTFAALCRGENDAYNNFASYFVLKLHLINKQTGESADVEYTLHEGFCNTDDGRRASTLAEKCHDFGSFRNVNYTYNINIAGINDITSYVTGEEGTAAEHPNGQSGNIWKMTYATGKSKTPIPIAGGTYNYDGKYMTFSENPDLGFRIYGLDDAGNTVDICYNMPEGMYEGFRGLWPTGSPLNVPKSETASLESLIPRKLLEGMKIGNGSAQYTVIELMRNISGGTLSPTGNYTTTFTKYDGKEEGLKGNFVRGLYIFDRNDVRNCADADGCSTYNVAYGAEQYPFLFEKLNFDPANIIWDNKFYAMASKLSTVVATTKNIFYGAECSKIDLRWKHDERIMGYRISVYNNNYTHPFITVTPEELPKYIKEINGEKIFIYPLNTSSFPRSGSTSANNYSFSVTPIVDPEMYGQGEATHIIHNAAGTDETCIRVCPTAWDITSTNDWKAVNNGYSGTYEIHYRGLSAMSPLRGSSGYGKPGQWFCFGGTGSTQEYYFSFWVSVPGKFQVAVKSHSTATNRNLLIARMSPEGAQTNGDGETYDVIYDSGSMATAKTTYTTGVVWPYDNEPTEYRIYAAGSVDYYKFEFIPSN